LIHEKDKKIAEDQSQIINLKNKSEDDSSMKKTIESLNKKIADMEQTLTENHSALDQYAKQTIQLQQKKEHTEASLNQIKSEVERLSSENQKLLDESTKLREQSELSNQKIFGLEQQVEELQEAVSYKLNIEFRMKVSKVKLEKRYLKKIWQKKFKKN
jgi:chromosome segregation ATPase